MTRTKINKKAKDIINKVFPAVLKSENKEDWKKAIDFARTQSLKIGGDRFVYEVVLRDLANKYGKKFIKIK